MLFTFRLFDFRQCGRTFGDEILPILAINSKRFWFDSPTVFHWASTRRLRVVFVSLSSSLWVIFFVHPQKKVGNLHKVACYQRASSDVEAILPAVFLRFKSRRLSKYVDISKFSMGGIYLISSLVKERLTLTLLERNDTITRAFYLITWLILVRISMGVIMIICVSSSVPGSYCSYV